MTWGWALGHAASVMHALRGSRCTIAHCACLFALSLLAGCSSAPPPDWKINAHNLLQSYARHYLNGDTRLAERNFERARAEIARTGRLDLAARAELTRCAIRLAALETEPCQGYVRLSAHAAAEDSAYARYLTGDWQGLDAGKLPQQYQALLKAKDDSALVRTLEEIEDPISRAIAAGVLFHVGRASPAVIAAATRTASDQGWRRALLAWLEVQAKRAEAAGDSASLERIRQRIDLVHASLADQRSSASPP
ncbi:MAG: hypothetical protein ACUVSD_09235 [Thiobacillaceae bacterium]